MNTTTNKNNIMISHTGVIHGAGSDWYKWVSGLTADERAHVRNGGIVLIEVDKPRRGQTPYKCVTYWRGRYGHRNYYAAEDVTS